MPCVPLSLGRQNKANSHSDADQEIGGAGGAGRGMLYKQSQFPPDQKEWQVLGGKGVMVNSASDRPQQNKANLARPGERCKTKPIPGYAERDVAAGGAAGPSCDIASMPRFGKQSQLLEIEPKRWRWNPPPYAGHTLQDGGRILILIGS